jgi:hypothetical protein
MDTGVGGSGWPRDSYGFYSLQPKGVSSQGAEEFLRGDDISNANDEKRLQDVDRGQFLDQACAPQYKSAGLDPNQVSFGSP